MANRNATLNGAVLEEVMALGEHRMYSVYLDLSIGSNGQRSHEVFLRKKESQFLELVGDDVEERERFESVMRTIRRWVADGFEESNLGAALFISTDGDLLKVVQLPVPPDEIFTLQAGPAIAPLARMVEDHDHHCVVVVDNKRARILSVYLNAVESEETYAHETLPQRSRGGGWSQARFQRHRTAHVQQFHAEVVDHLQRFVKQHESDDIILLGTAEATADLQKELPPALRERVRFVATASPDEPSSAVVERIREVLEKERAREDEEILHGLERRVREDYLAVAGVRSTLRELQAGKVETLVVGRGLPRAGQQCTRCTFLLADGESACPYCGGELEPVDLYDKMVALAERHEAKVEFLDGQAESELLRRMNGVGAFLKFT